MNRTRDSFGICCGVPLLQASYIVAAAVVIVVDIVHHFMHTNLRLFSLVLFIYLCFITMKMTNIIIPLTPHRHPHPTIPYHFILRFVLFLFLFLFRLVFGYAGRHESRLC